MDEPVEFEKQPAEVQGYMKLSIILENYIGYTPI